MHSSQMMTASTAKAHSTNGNGIEGGTPPTHRIRGAKVLKAFEEDQWEIFDGPAKALGIKFWDAMDCGCIENEDPFGIDLIVERNGKTFGCEVEIRQKWHGTDFPFDSLYLPLRKKKFAKDKSVLMVINNSQTHATYVRAEDVLNSPVVENKNERVPSGEKFYCVPLDKCQHINLLAMIKPSEGN
jgi:hypothetical protein